MAGVLPAEPSKWAEIIEGSGEKALLSPVSSKNVERVLSTAAVRGPQKNLYKAVLPLLSKMVEDIHGVSILTSLVKYSTPKTVEGLVRELLSTDKELWTLQKEPSETLASALGELLDALVYREDCREEASREVISSLSADKAEKLLGSLFTLRAAGRLFCVDAEFAGRVMKEEQGKKALREAGASGPKKRSAVVFCERILSSSEANSAASKYLFEVFFTASCDTARRPREEILLAMASKATPDVVSQMTKALLTWPNLRELLQREAYASIFAEINLRADDADAAERLTLNLFESVAEIDAMLASRKKASLRLLAAIAGKPTVVAALEKKLHAPLSGKLRGSQVRYTAASLPCALATQQAILAKLGHLCQENGKAASHANNEGNKQAVRKRARE